MAVASTSNIHPLLFDGVTTRDCNSFENDLEELDEQRPDSEEQGTRRPSVYVDSFETMVKTVLEHEHFLLSRHELDALDYFSKFCYNTRYCLVRLILRKPDQWHALSTLQNFKKEVGEEGLLSSIANLCQPLRVIFPIDASEPNDSFVKREPVVADIPIKTEDDSCEIIDLTFDNEEEERKLVKDEVTADLVQTCPQSSLVDMSFDFFCEDETKMSLGDILWQLNKDQLLVLVKSTKCKLSPSGSKKVDIIASLQRTAASQSVLISPIRQEKEKSKRHTLPFLSIGKLSRTGKLKMTQEYRLRQMALELLGKSVRVNFEFYRLVRRINMIYHREKEYTTSLMVPVLLTLFKKRNYPPYEHTRHSNIWTSREDLLEYEQALEAEKALEQIMETPADTGGRRATKTPGSSYGRDGFVTPAPRMTFTTPLMTPGSVADVDISETPRTKKEEEPDQKYLGVNDLEAEELRASAVISKDQEVTNYLTDFIFPKWRESLSIREDQKGHSRSPALERFETGYVYTRMLEKVARSFGPLKKYDDELIILNCLLGQKYWRRGKRADWYDRRAIVEWHLWGRDKDDNLLRQSLQGITQALSDEDTRIVLRPKLELRLSKLEKKLGIPEAHRFICDGELKKPQTIEVRAVRVYPTKLGSPNEKETPAKPSLHPYVSVTKKNKEKKSEEPKPVRKKLGQKSSWEGRGGQIVNVETRALEHYEDLGFTGFHCETKILTTLFSLLFWDVLFANVPGALDTPFQEAPLDLYDDTFYYARKDLIEARLAEIGDGKGPEILLRHDQQYREKDTWCVGLSWDLCEREDLVDIVKCLGGKSLSRICRLFCEDYKGRSSGGPDLFIWKTEQQVCKFVEVKGPGDTPQENQKLWFHALLGAKVAVEICKVIDITTYNNPSKGKKRKVKTPLAASSSRKKRKAQASDSEPEEEDYEQLDAELEPELNGEFATRPEKRRRHGLAEPTHSPRLSQIEQPLMIHH